MGIDISRLGPAAQAQIKAELARRDRENKGKQVQETARKCKQLPQMGSKLEQNYYAAYIWPKILAGQVTSCELQKRFDLLPSTEYCGIKLPAAHYTPDFVITYTNGTVEVVETKNKMIRKLQRDYIYRRRLFIERYARPNGWIFTEYIEE